jgi:subtilisin-like proprotein convertase family protein
MHSSIFYKNWQRLGQSQSRRLQRIVLGVMVFLLLALGGMIWALPRLPRHLSRSLKNVWLQWTLPAHYTAPALLAERLAGQAGVNPAKAAQSVLGNGVLRIDPHNRRYFADGRGRLVYLTGSHTWANFQDNGYGDPPPVFDYAAYLDFLQQNNHNFTRLWVWEQARWSVEIDDDDYWFSPMAPYVRSGPGLARDGKPKFDLSRFDQAYFDRLRQRVRQAGERGIYVAVMLFDGWSVASQKGSFGVRNPWLGHPYRRENNINGIDPDRNRNNSGEEVHELGDTRVTHLQEAYVRRVIDTLNDLDNVLYEVSNESHAEATAWQIHMVDFIKYYQAGKPKQHPVGMTVEYPGGDNAELYASRADWISPNGNIDQPEPADGRKVVLADSDHLCGICGDYHWVWKSFLSGENPIFMDTYDGRALGLEHYQLNNPVWVLLRRNLGYTRAYAQRINLAAMQPNAWRSSTGYALFNHTVGQAEALVYQPQAAVFTVDLSSMNGSFAVEWFNPINGQVSHAVAVIGGATHKFTPPFRQGAVLYLAQNSTPIPSATSTVTVLPTSTPLASGSVCKHYKSKLLELALPNGQNQSRSSLFIADDMPISDLNVSVAMSHTYIGDLSITLAHQETGAKVTVFDRPGYPATRFGCQYDDLYVDISDEAERRIETECAPQLPTINGKFQPNVPLSLFDGQSSRGTWLLELYDWYPSVDAGVLHHWKLRICPPEVDSADADAHVDEDFPPISSVPLALPQADTRSGLQTLYLPLLLR